MNARHPQGRNRRRAALRRDRGAAHVPAARPRRTRSTTTRATCASSRATSRATAATIVTERRRGRSRVSTPVNDQSEVPARVPARVRCSGTSPDTSRSSTATPVSRRSTTPSCSVATSACRPAASPTSSTPHNPTGTVVLTLTKAAQQAAKDALRGRRGSVVVLDVQDRRHRRDVLRTRPTTRPRSRATTPSGRAEVLRLSLERSRRTPTSRRALPRALSRPGRRSRCSPPRSRSTAASS